MRPLLFVYAVWTPLCAVALAMYSQSLFILDVAPGWLEIWLFCSTFFVYQFTHRSRLLRWTAWGMGLFSGICFLFLPREVQLFTPLPAVVWVGYFWSLRGHPVAKPLLVAGVWLLVTHFMVLPWPMAVQGWPVAVVRFGLIFALALGYDLLDRLYDQRLDTATLALVLGGRNIFLVCALALGIAALALLAGYSGHFFSGIQLCLQLIPLLGALVLIYRIRHWEIQNESAILWTKMALDGMMLLQYMLYFCPLK